MSKLKGFDKITRELNDAQKVLGDLDGQIGTVNFNPDDPESIEAAISSMEQIIDERVGRYANNSIIGPMADEMKTSYRQAILDRAAEARVNGKDD
jgi:hypothetical protein